MLVDDEQSNLTLVKLVRQLDYKHVMQVIQVKFMVANLDGICLPIYH